MDTHKILPIESRHDACLARVIRQTISEFVEPHNRPFTSMNDVQIDSLSSFYNSSERQFWVIEDGEGEVAGGCGFAPLQGGSNDTCELQKMYFNPSARGKGLGKALLQLCLKEAHAVGFKLCYIETLSNMLTAQALYIAHGFSPIPAPLGTTGHTYCDRFFIKDLS